MQRPKAVLKFASVVALAMSVFPALTFAQHYN